MPTWLEAILHFAHEAITVIAHITAIGAYSIAIYLFVHKRNEFSTLFRLLVGFTQQQSLSELKEKLERLGEYSADDVKEQGSIVNILSDIQGQLLGNEKLRVPFAEIERSIEELVSDRKQLTERKKRKFVAEMREKLRHLSVQSIDDLQVTKGSSHE